MADSMQVAVVDFGGQAANVLQNQSVTSQYLALGSAGSVSLPSADGTAIYVAGPNNAGTSLNFQVFSATSGALTSEFVLIANTVRSATVLGIYLNPGKSTEVSVMAYVQTSGRGSSDVVQVIVNGTTVTTGSVNSTASDNAHMKWAVGSTSPYGYSDLVEVVETLQDDGTFASNLATKDLIADTFNPYQVPISGVEDSAWGATSNTLYTMGTFENNGDPSQCTPVITTIDGSQSSPIITRENLSTAPVLNQDPVDSSGNPLQAVRPLATGSTAVWTNSSTGVSYMAANVASDTVYDGNIRNSTVVWLYRGTPSNKPISQSIPSAMVTPFTSYTYLQNLFDRRNKSTMGWIGGDGAASCRASTGKDFWFFGDSGIGTMDSNYNVITSSPWNIIHNAVVRTDVNNANTFDSFYGAVNILASDTMTHKRLDASNQTNCTVRLTPQWSPFAGLSHQMTVTSAGNAYFIIGYNFFGNLGAFQMTAGQTYTLTGTMRGTNTPRQVQLGIAWTDSNNNIVSWTYGAPQWEQSVDTDMRFVITAPAGVTQGTLVWQVLNAQAGENHWGGRWGVFTSGNLSPQTFNYGGDPANPLRGKALISPVGMPHDVVGVATHAAFQANNMRGALSGNNAGNERRVLVLGGSTAEGVGVNGWQNRFQQVMQQQLRSLYPSNSGVGKKTTVGYLSATQTSNVTSKPTTLGTGTTVDGDTTITGAKGVNLATTGGVVTYPSLACDAIDVYYVQREQSTVANLQVVVDGTVVATINTSGATGTGIVPKHQRYTMPAPGGSHVVALQTPSSGNTASVTVLGVEFRDTGTDDIYLFEAARDGYTIDRYADSSTATTNLWNHLRDANPGLLIAVVGATEMASMSLGQYSQALQYFISRAQSEIKVGGWPIPIVFVQEGALPSQTVGTDANPGTFLQYESTAINTATQCLNMDFVPMRRLGALQPTDSGWSSDGIHPNDSGMAQFCTVISKASWDTLGSSTIWLGGCWASGSKIYAVGMQNTYPFNPNGQAASVLTPQQTIIAQWDATSMNLDRVDTLPCSDPDSTKQWTTTCWVEGGYVYIFGKDSQNQPYVMQCDPDNPFNLGTNLVWSANGWTNQSGTPAQPISTNQSTIDSIRKMKGTYHAYMMKSDCTSIYEMTSSSLTGPWTVNPTTIYSTPESAPTANYGNEYCYIPRQHPQFDSASGLIMGYSTNFTNGGFTHMSRPPFVTSSPQSMTPMAHQTTAMTLSSSGFWGQSDIPPMSASITALAVDDIHKSVGATNPLADTSDTTYLELDFSGDWPYEQFLGGQLAAWSLPAKRKFDRLTISADVQVIVSDNGTVNLRFGVGAADGTVMPNSNELFGTRVVSFGNGTSSITTVVSPDLPLDPIFSGSSFVPGLLSAGNLVAGIYLDPQTTSQNAVIRLMGVRVTVATTSTA